MAVFPKGAVRWDDDLLKNSEGRNVDGMQLETLVKVRSYPLECFRCR